MLYAIPSLANTLQERRDSIHETGELGLLSVSLRCYARQAIKQPCTYIGVKKLNDVEERKERVVGLVDKGLATTPYIAKRW
jgi:hypothetical protein